MVGATRLTGIRSASYLAAAGILLGSACSQADGPPGTQAPGAGAKPPPPSEARAPVPLDTLLAQLRAASPKTRALAATALADSGPAVAIRMQALRRALDDSDREVGEAVVWALGTIGAPAVPVLAGALSDPRAVVRIRALSALARVGQPADAVREQIRQAMYDPDVSVQKMAAVAIARIGPRPSRGAGAPALGTVADLRAGLAASNPLTRMSAVRRFQPFVDDPAQSIRLLLRALGDVDPGVRGAAADALVAIGPPARPALTAALADANPVVRREASIALVRLGPRAPGIK